MNIFCHQLFDFINLFYGSLDEKMKKFQVYKVTYLLEIPITLSLRVLKKRCKIRWILFSKVPTMQDELVMVSGMPILNGLSNQLPLTFKYKPTSEISTWGSSSFLFPSSSDPTFLLLIDFAKIHFVHSQGDQHVSEIALMALDLLAGGLTLFQSPHIYVSSRCKENSVCLSST